MKIIISNAFTTYFYFNNDYYYHLREDD